MLCKRKVGRKIECSLLFDGDVFLVTDLFCSGTVTGGCRKSALSLAGCFAWLSFSLVRVDSGSGLFEGL